jgi:peptidoglycan hydrolase-like protein with peptidoglycan-binding domain
MFCEARTRALVAALAALVVLLCAPSAGFAATDTAELLAPGAGYATPNGSQPVRDVQRLLRRLGDAPGPIDGLYGPLTAAAVQRFQEAHALAVDGVVGPQTRGRLVAERTKLRRAKLERKSPDRTNRAESVTEQPPASSPGNAQPDRGKPAQSDRAKPAPPDRAKPAPPERGKPESSSGPSPQLAAVVGGLALALLLVVLWRLARRHRKRPRGQPAAGPRLGLVCAALLAAYVIGAATGAVFANHATPDRHPEPSTATAEPRTR